MIGMQSKTTMLANLGKEGGEMLMRAMTSLRRYYMASYLQQLRKEK
jgi:hypothetical protein